MTKKHVLFTLIISMGTVWRFLELLEYGEIQTRKVDTYMFFYAIAACAVAYFAGKESAKEATKERERQKTLQAEYAQKTDQNTNNKK